MSYKCLIHAFKRYRDNTMNINCRNKNFKAMRLPELSSLRGSTSVSEHLNMKIVTQVCYWLTVALLAVFSHNFSDIIMMAYIRDGEPSQRRVPIFRHLQSENIWRAKTKNKESEYWAIPIAYNITFLYRLFCFTFSLLGQHSWAAIKSAHSSRIEASLRQRCDEICNMGSRGV